MRCRRFPYMHVEGAYLRFTSVKIMFDGFGGKSYGLLRIDILDFVLSQKHFGSLLWEQDSIGSILFCLLQSGMCVRFVSLIHALFGVTAVEFIDTVWRNYCFFVLSSDVTVACNSCNTIVTICLSTLSMGEEIVALDNR